MSCVAADRCMTKTLNYIIEDGCVMQRIVFGSLAVLTTCFWFDDKPCNAGLIVAASSGEVKFAGDLTPLEDNLIEVDFQGNFFGSAVSKILISENGNIIFDASKDSFFPDVGDRQSRIAPLWDDYLFLPGSSPENRILTHQTSRYLGVTWENVRLFNETSGGGSFPTSNRAAQVLWFTQDTQINGFDFKADDIAFSYSDEAVRKASMGPSVQESLVGLQHEIQTNIIVGNGLIGDGDAGKLGLGENLDGFLLFRRNGNSYDITAVPEPSSLLCIAIAISVSSIASARRKRALRRSSHHHKTNRST
jgi:hypothetical protein